MQSTRQVRGGLGQWSVAFQGSVLAAALVSSAMSTVVFILAPDVGVLIIGRILSGLSAA